MKTCKTCKKSLPLNLFPTRKLSKDGRRSECRKCFGNADFKYKAKQFGISVDDPLYWRKRELLKRYKLTYDAYLTMLVKQNFACAICKYPSGDKDAKSFHVDHCHKTGKIRGLLCSSCNHGIGQFKDNVEILQNDINYLELQYGR